MLPNWLKLRQGGRDDAPSLHLFGTEEITIEGSTYLIAPYFYSPGTLNRRKYLVNKEYGLRVKLTIPITGSMADQLMQGPLLVSLI